MKKILVLALSIILILVAGCTTTSPGTNVPATVLPTTSSGPVFPADALPMNATVVLGNATHQTTVFVDSFEVAPNETGSHTITIYVAAKNTGKDPIKFVWFSKLTDMRGNYYGGIGVSHGGNGARSAWIQPNFTEEARDYVVVDSDVGLAALSKGAVLDVYFMEQQDNVTHSMVPDYHMTWAIPPGTIV